MIKVLFVCHGNICRSPMAEFVMKKLVCDSDDELKPAGLSPEDFEIASAATSTEEIGNPVYPPARRLLNARGIDCSGHAARQMTSRDYDHYDYIVLMDRNNLRNLRWNLMPDQLKDESGKISLLLDWTKRPGDVADPWYTGDFEATWRDVNEGCRGLLHEIVSRKLACRTDP